MRCFVLYDVVCARVCVCVCVCVCALRSFVLYHVVCFWVSESDERATKERRKSDERATK